MKISEKSKRIIVQILSVGFTLIAAASLAISLGTYFGFFAIEAVNGSTVTLVLGMITAILSGLIASGFLEI